MSCYCSPNTSFYCQALAAPCCHTSSAPCSFPYPKYSTRISKNTELRSILKKPTEPVDTYEANEVCPRLIRRCPFKRMVSSGLIDSARCVCMQPRLPWYVTFDEEELELLKKEQENDFKHWLYHHKSYYNPDWRCHSYQPPVMSCTSAMKSEVIANQIHQQNQPIICPFQLSSKAGVVDTKHCFCTA